MSVSISAIENKFSEENRISYFLANYEKILKEVDAAVAAGNIKQLRAIGYRFLNLARNRQRPSRIQYDLCSQFSKFEKANPETIGKILKEILEDVLTSAQSRLKILKEPTLSKPELSEEVPCWTTTQQGMAATQKVHVVHGGGLQYILAFLKGEEPGYKLEDIEGIIARKGIQVHPSVEEPEADILDRVGEYATSRSAQSLDFPAYITAEIPGQYLDAAPNEYEAGLRNGFQHHLENQKIFLVFSKYPSIAERELGEIPKPLLFEIFKLNKSPEYLDNIDKTYPTARQRSAKITYFFDSFKKAKKYSEIEKIFSIIKDYNPEELSETRRSP